MGSAKPELGLVGNSANGVNHELDVNASVRQTVLPALGFVS